MIGCFGVFPDGASHPAAVFRELEDALDWGLHRYGDDQFKIRYVPVLRVEQGDGTGSEG